MAAHSRAASGLAACECLFAPPSLFFCSQVFLFFLSFFCFFLCNLPTLTFFYIVSCDMARVAGCRSRSRWATRPYSLLPLPFPNSQATGSVRARMRVVARVRRLLRLLHCSL